MANPYGSPTGPKGSKLFFALANAGQARQRQCSIRKPMEKPYQLNIVLRINFTALIATAAVVDSVCGWKMQVTAHPRR